MAFPILICLLCLADLTSEDSINVYQHAIVLVEVHDGDVHGLDSVAVWGEGPNSAFELSTNSDGRVSIQTIFEEDGRLEIRAGKAGFLNSDTVEVALNDESGRWMHVRIKLKTATEALATAVVSGTKKFIVHVCKPEVCAFPYDLASGTGDGPANRTSTETKVQISSLASSWTLGGGESDGQEEKHGEFEEPFRETKVWKLPRSFEEAFSYRLFILSITLNNNTMMDEEAGARVSVKLEGFGGPEDPLEVGDELDGLEGLEFDYCHIGCLDAKSFTFKPVLEFRNLTEWDYTTPENFSEALC